MSVLKPASILVNANMSVAYHLLNLRYKANLSLAYPAKGNVEFECLIRDSDQDNPGNVY